MNITPKLVDFVPLFFDLLELDFIRVESLLEHQPIPSQQEHLHGQGARAPVVDDESVSTQNGGTTSVCSAIIIPSPMDNTSYAVEEEKIFDTI